MRNRIHLLLSEHAHSVRRLSCQQTGMKGLCEPADTSENRGGYVWALISAPLSFASCGPTRECMWGEARQQLSHVI